MFTTLINKVKELTYTTDEALEAAGSEIAGRKFKEFTVSQRGLGAKEILENVKAERTEYDSIFKQQEENLAWKRKKFKELTDKNQQIYEDVKQYPFYTKDEQIARVFFGEDADVALDIANSIKDIEDLEKVMLAYEKYLDRLGTLQSATELKLSGKTKISEAAVFGGGAADKLEDIKKNIKVIIDFNKRIADTQAAIDFENAKKK